MPLTPTDTGVRRPGTSKVFQQMSADIAGLAFNVKGPDRLPYVTDPARPEILAKCWLIITKQPLNNDHF
jgi:hypothetical protein